MKSEFGSNFPIATCKVILFDEDGKEIGCPPVCEKCQTIKSLVAGTLNFEFVCTTCREYNIVITCD